MVGTLTIVFISLGSIALLLLIIVLIRHFSSHRKLQRKLATFFVHAEKQSLDFLKKEYLAIYKLYMKVGHTHKEDAYEKVIHARKKVEEHMQGSLKMDALLARIRTAKDKRAAFTKIQKFYVSLPKKLQEKYHASIVHLKEGL